MQIAGKRTLSETADGLSFEIGPETFFQNNLAGLEQLVENCSTARTQANPPTVAIDAHCGVGAFTLPVAQTAKAAFGLDLQAEAIALATSNARANGIMNANFRVGHLGKLGTVKADLVLLDPPRGGCWSEDLEALERITPTTHLIHLLQSHHPRP